MSEQLKPVLRTSITMADFVRGFVRSAIASGQPLPSEAAVAVAYAQYAIETGAGPNCFNYNVGNVKHVKGDGFDYHMLNGVWEGTTPDRAAQLIASGRVIADPSPNHAKAVGEGRVSVLYVPPDPATWFRAFSSLDEGMGAHLAILMKRFSRSWTVLLSGDYVLFAKTLHAQGYFTANPDAYARGMRPSYEALIATRTYEDLVATLTTPDTTLPESVSHHEACLWEEDWGSGATVHADVPWPSYRDGDT